MTKLFGNLILKKTMHLYLARSNITSPNGSLKLAATLLGYFILDGSMTSTPLNEQLMSVNSPSKLYMVKIEWFIIYSHLNTIYIIL